MAKEMEKLKRQLESRDGAKGDVNYEQLLPMILGEINEIDVSCTERIPDVYICVELK